MKLPPVLSGVVLDPAAGTLDFSALGVAFDPRTVLAVLHEPTNRFLFAKGRSGLGYTLITGAVMNLAADTTGLAAGPLTTFRDDGALIATDARLEACRALLATISTTASNVLTALGTPSDVDPGSDTAPGSVLALLRRGLGRWTTFLGRFPAALGPATAAGSIPVTLPADGQFAASVGLPADAAAASDAGAASLTALSKRGLGNWTTLLGRVPAPVSGRVPVDGSAVTQPISAAALPLPAGAASAAAQGTGNASLASIDGKFPPPISGRTPVDGSGVTQPVSAASLPLPAGAATATNQASAIAALGGTGDAAYGGAGAASIIAALKGLYATMVAATPAGANVIGSTTLRSAGTNRSATVGTTASVLMTANAARQGWKIKNDSAGDIWINVAAAATAAAGSGNIKIPSGGYLTSEPGFVETGAMSAIGSAASLAITAREH